MVLMVFFAALSWCWSNCVVYFLWVVRIKVLRRLILWISSSFFKRLDFNITSLWLFSEKGKIKLIFVLSQLVRYGVFWKSKLELPKCGSGHFYFLSSTSFFCSLFLPSMGFRFGLELMLTPLMNTLNQWTDAKMYKMYRCINVQMNVCKEIRCQEYFHGV